MSNETCPSDRAALSVSISREGEAIWSRCAHPPSGITSSAYLGDGTMLHIVTALTDALSQAQAELGSF